MPELPEVETTLKGISPHILGQTIQQVIVRQASLRWPIDPKIINLKNQTITSVHRRAKYIVMETTGGNIIWHLGMSGNMRIMAQGSAVEKHDHVDVLLKNQQLLRYTDPRRFGACIYELQNPLKHKLLQSLGPEPLSDDFNIEHMLALSKNKNTSIKQFIMDSHVVCGVGNIYACESLFKSGIHPTRKANNVSRKRYLILIQQIKDVLQNSIEQGGTTLKDFIGNDGKPGYFKQHLNVYGRKDEACFVCAKPIKSIKQAQRTTFYCAHCQH